MSPVIWRPHPAQAKFLRSGHYEVFYGGAAGGGKSDALVLDAIRYAWHPRYRGLLMRRTFPELGELLDRTRRLYPQLIPGSEYKASEHKWYFPSGSALKLGHCQNPDDIYAYQGSEFQWIGIDEAPHFEGKMYLYIFSRLRTTVPELRPLMRATGNPGGVGHQFFKDRFKIGLVEPGSTLFDEFVVPDTGECIKISRCYIPATVYDNPTLMTNDPGYIQRLMQLPEIEKRRLLYGDWDRFEGQFFSELNQEVHGADPFPIPPEWERFRVFDWGYAKPFAVLWFAADYDGRLWLYREWYGCREGETDRGLKMTATEIARGIKERERGETVRLGPADPSIWSRRPQKDGTLGISVSDEMGQEGVHWIKADNDRVLGWQQIHTRLKLDDEGQPMLRVFNSCANFWRTLPLMQEYKGNPEDTDTKGEDHIADAVRYACMGRPLRPRPRARADFGSFQAERKKLIAARALAARRGISLSDAYRSTR